MVLGLPYAGHYLRDSKKPELGKYFKRRLVRIELPYLITLTLFYLYGAFFDGDGWTGRLPNYLAGLVYAHTVIFDGALNPILTVSWTLEIEIQFYLLAPFLCRVFAVRGDFLRRGLLVGLVFLSQKFSGWANAVVESSAWHHSLLGQLGYFFVGFLLTDLYLSYWRDRRPSACEGRIWDAVGLVAWPAAFFLIGRTAVNWTPFVLLVGFAAVLRGGVLSRVFSNPWACAVGTMCYTIYLFDSFIYYRILCPLIFDTTDVIQAGNWPLNYLLITIFCAVAIGICALIFLVVEKPFARGRLPFAKDRSRSEPPAG